MDENRADNISRSFQVTLELSEYTVVAGKTVEIGIHIQNTGAWGDYFKANLLGIPLGWIIVSGPPAVWIEEGENGKASLTIRPPATALSGSGTYPARVHVFGQSAPEVGKELEFVLNVIPGEQTQKTDTAVNPGTGASEPVGRIGVTLRSAQFSTTPGSSVTIPLVMQNRGLDTDVFRLWVEEIPVNWVSTASAATSLGTGKKQRDCAGHCTSSRPIQPGWTA